MNREAKLLARWILIAGGFFALLWLYWYEQFGHIPAVTMVWVEEPNTSHLPFAVSRLWDIGLAPVWATAAILLFHGSENDKKFLRFSWIVAVLGWVPAAPGIISYSLFLLPPAFGTTNGIMGKSYANFSSVSFRVLLFGSFATGFASQLPICLWYGFAVGLVVSLAAGFIGGGSCFLAFGARSFGPWLLKNRKRMISWALVKNGE